MEATTNINISGVPVSIVEKLKRRNRVFSRAAVEALKAGVKILETKDARASNATQAQPKKD